LQSVICIPKGQEDSVTAKAICIDFNKISLNDRDQQIGLLIMGNCTHSLDVAEVKSEAKAD